MQYMSAVKFFVRLAFEQIIQFFKAPRKMMVELSFILAGLCERNMKGR